MQAIKSSQAASNAEKHENLTGKMAKKDRRQPKCDSLVDLVRRYPKFSIST